MDSGLRGKSALVTGGTGGIGRAIALALAAEGVDVAVVGLERDPRLSDELQARSVHEEHPLGGSGRRE